MSFHRNLIDDNIHALTARTYADVAARDADTAFQVIGNVDKTVRIITPTAYYTLASVDPTVWVEFTNTGSDTLAEILANGNTSGGTEIDMEATKIIDVLDPTADQDAATKKYVDDSVGAQDTLAEILANGNTSGGSDLIMSSNDNLLVTDNMSVGSVAAPVTDSSIDLKSSTAAFVMNRGTEAQRDAITAIEGMQFYNLDVNDQEFYNGTSWVSTGGGDVTGPASSIDNEVPRFNGTSGKNIQAGTGVFVDDSGNLGVGTSTPADRLEVEGSVMFSNADVHLNSSTRPSIFPQGDNVPTDLDVQLRSNGAGTLQLNADASGDVTMVTGGGSVGIGTLTPAFKLEVDSSLDEAVVADFHAGISGSVRVRSEAGKTLQILAGSNGTVISASASAFLAFAANSDNDTSNPSNEVMRITSTGSVGIGTTSPGINAALAVEGGQITTGGGIGLDGALFSTTDTLVLGNTGAVFTVGIHDDKVGIGLLNPTRNLEVLGDGFFTSDLTTQGIFNCSLTGVFGGNITSDGRRVTTDGSSTTEIFTMADFPVPIAGVITLSSGLYIVKENIVTGDRFEIEAGAIVTIEVDDSHGQSITYTGDVACFTSVDYTRIAFDKFNLLCTGTNASAFSFTGAGAFTLANGRIVMIGSNSAIGLVERSGVFALRNFTLALFANGLNLVECDAIQVQTVVIQPNLAAVTNIFTLTGAAALGASFDLIPAVIGPGTNLFDIDPIYGKGISISNISKLGPGPFFRIGGSGTITSFSDESRAGVIITQVAGSPSLGPSFESVAHDLSVGEIITQSGFAVSEYNGTFTVSEIVDADFYNLKNAVYNGNHDGVFDTTTTRALIGGTVNEGESVNIVDTSNFNGGYTAFNVSAGQFDFSLGASFPGTETGNWNTNSLDETSKFVGVTNAGEQRSSQNRAFGQMNDNANITTIVAADTYQEMNVDNMVQDDTTELWTLIDPISGLWRYDGLNPFSGTLSATIWASKAGSTRNIRFAVAIDLVVPVFATAFYTPMEVKSTKVEAALLKPLSVTPGQTVLIMIAEEGASDSITITDIAVNIQGIT